VSERIAGKVAQIAPSVMRLASVRTLGVFDVKIHVIPKLRNQSWGSMLPTRCWHSHKITLPDIGKTICPETAKENDDEND
jgi:hypothetical protein